MFKTLGLRDRSAEVYETWRVYLWSGDTTSRKQNFEFRPLRRSEEMTLPDRGCLFVRNVLTVCNRMVTNGLTNKLRLKNKTSRTVVI